MSKLVKQPHGGAIKLQEKGDKSSNPKGRPKVPKNLKEFIKSLENSNDEIKIPVEACEKKTINGKEYYVLKSTSGVKLAMSAYNRALKGDIRFLDWLTKMGYAGGYEANKQEITGKEGGELQITINKIIKND